MNLLNIRNFAIISHIDHGKSTLADRFLELTNTVSKREMKEQFLDNMELEREKGITIKMRPVRMIFGEYILNLIDTPGHIDFSYEVSRALAATEGVILLVDATQGIQAQTLTNIDIAKSLNLKIIPAVNKIDAAHARIEETKDDIVNLLKCDKNEILEISGKTGAGVENLLYAVIERIHPPKTEYKDSGPRALIFDFEYSEHKGIISYIRVFDGIIKKEQELNLLKSKVKFKVKEIGFFTPDYSAQNELRAGEIGYIVSSLKEPSIVKVGDTIVSPLNFLPGLSGYKNPKPVIWANFFPVSQAEFEMLKKALLKLSLNDSALSFEEIHATAVGRGFRLGFLGMLHLEIIAERLKREFKIETINTLPSVVYLVEYSDKFKNSTINTVSDLEEKNISEKIYSAANFPDDFKISLIKEIWVDAEILAPEYQANDILRLLKEFEGELKDVLNFSGNRIIIKAEMPLRELMRGFFDRLKSVSSGYASFNYEIDPVKNQTNESFVVKNDGAEKIKVNNNLDELILNRTSERGEKWRVANVTRLDILINEEEISALSRIVPEHRLNKEAEEIVEKLKNLLPRALYLIKIQAKAHGRIIASRSISAFKKDVAGYLYGGDRTRKMKLWQKQKKGKSRLKEKSRYQIPPDVFLKVMK